jgi:predicted acetyltransferase
MELPYKINYEIADFIINEKYRGKGYGKKILKLILNNINGNIFLWTTINNTNAISLYKKFGFQEITLSHKLIKFYKSKNKWIKTNIIGFILYNNTIQ